MIESVQFELIEANAQNAKLVVRVALTPSVTDKNGLSITGVIRGPSCDRAQTLACDFVLESTIEEPLTAMALIADPCYWSVDLPMRYDLSIDLTRNGAIVESRQDSIALKRPTSETVDELGLN